MVFSNWCHRKAKYLGRNWVTFIDNFVPCSFTSWKIAFCFSSSSPSLPAWFFFFFYLWNDLWPKILAEKSGKLHAFPQALRSCFFGCLQCFLWNWLFQGGLLTFPHYFWGKTKGQLPSFYSFNALHRNWVYELVHQLLFINSSSCPRVQLCRGEEISWGEDCFSFPHVERGLHTRVFSLSLPSYSTVTWKKKGHLPLIQPPAQSRTSSKDQLQRFLWSPMR